MTAPARRGRGAGDVGSAAGVERRPPRVAERRAQSRRDIDAALAKAKADADKPHPCDMKHQPPHDFAHCVTHDTTFALGDKCEWDGVTSIWEHLYDKADKQRARAVLAEMRAEKAEATLRAKADQSVIAAVRTIGAQHRPVSISVVRDSITCACGHESTNTDGLEEHRATLIAEAVDQWGWNLVHEAVMDPARFNALLLEREEDDRG